MDKRLILAATLLAQACTPYVLSPPARAIPLESAATVGEDHTAVQAEGGVSGEVFGSGIAHGTVRVRHGLTPDLEISAEANALIFTNLFATEEHRGIYSARVGVKHSFSPHFALTGGLGGGGSAAGGFFSPDVGFIAGYENPYAVPFVSGRLLLSQPFATRTVTIDDGDDNMDDDVTAAPDLTYGFAVGTGVRIPLGPRGEPTFALSTGVGLTFLSDGGEGRGYPGFSVGLERIY